MAFHSRDIPVCKHIERCFSRLFVDIVEDTNFFQNAKRIWAYEEI